MSSAPGLGDLCFHLGGDHDPRAEGHPGGTYFQPARSYLVTAVAQLGSNCSHVGSCKHIRQSRVVSCTPKVTQRGVGAGSHCLESSIKSNAEEIRPSLLSC